MKAHTRISIPFFWCARDNIRPHAPCLGYIEKMCFIGYFHSFRSSHVRLSLYIYFISNHHLLCVWPIICLVGSISFIYSATGLRLVFFTNVLCKPSSSTMRLYDVADMILEEPGDFESNSGCAASGNLDIQFISTWASSMK